MRVFCASLLAGLVGLTTSVFAAGLFGDDTPTVEVKYQRPAERDIPPEIVKVAVAEFKGKTSDDQRWGDIASDMLASELGKVGNDKPRFEMVDRKRLGQIMAERDLQMAISDSSAATKLGQLANVHAIQYGTVSASTEDQRVSKIGAASLAGAVLSRGAPKEEHSTKRLCHVTVTFTLDAVQTGKTLASYTVSRSYDSDKDKDNQNFVKKAFQGQKMPSADEMLTAMIDECVQEYLAKICPHTVCFKEKLESGKTKDVKTGNQFAAAGEYADALAAYEKAIAAKSDDAGAQFNAGLMCEALGKLKEAEEFYSKALAIKVDKKYIAARKRVRGEINP